ncbi:hypothetical protein BHM03_00019169 [Ensete ventricosum]|uniref:Uncharacterized protein n=1 Tax=Ensete ventricosum TaxID=4639 RepID=A0A445MFP7_ENSVE|nr:hypothetical protein BHM03_00019169 [Ensete ventricosum]
MYRVDLVAMDANRVWEIPWKGVTGNHDILIPRLDLGYYMRSFEDFIADAYKSTIMVKDSSFVLPQVMVRAIKRDS